MQTLHLRIENQTDLPNGGPVPLTLAGQSAKVGRKAGMDWVLPDASRHISGHHFDISYHDGRYFLSDVSANGTFLHGQHHRLTAAHEITHGQRYTVGQYIIRANLETTPNLQNNPHLAVSAPPASQALDAWNDQPPQRSNMMASPSPAHNDRQMPPGSQDPQPAVHLQAAPIQSPHQTVIQTPSHAISQRPNQAQLQTPTSRHAKPQAPPPPVRSPAPLPHVPPNQAQVAQQSLGHSAQITPPAPPPNAQDAFLKAFLAGAGLPADTPVNLPPQELGRMLGQCARMGTNELMKMLTDRAAVKMFFSKQDRTMLGAIDNNPLKFMNDKDAAFAALFLTPQNGYMKGPEGFANALTDVRRHQAAVVAALQPALAEMIDGLSPEEIKEQTSGGRLGGKTKKQWEEYVDRWDKKAATGENGMLDSFIDAFSRYYSDAMNKM